MNVYITSASDEETVAMLGPSYDIGSASGFSEFESKYLYAYRKVADGIRGIADLDDNASTGAYIAMSSWVDPSRCIDVVIETREVLSPSLLRACIDAVDSIFNDIGEKFGVRLECYPTEVYVFPGENIYIFSESVAEDLLAMGLST